MQARLTVTDFYFCTKATHDAFMTEHLTFQNSTTTTYSLNDILIISNNTFTSY